MELITPTDLGGDADRARRVIAVARSIAPCLDSLEGESKSDAVAILKGVLAESAPAGSRRVRSQRVGSAAVDYFDAPSAFTDDDRAGLRALCGAASAGAGHPIGSFPTKSIVARVWPEESCEPTR